MSLKSAVIGDDRETSIKTQIIAVQKTINKSEVPLKQKHARQVIMGTHKDKSCTIFWNCISHIQLEKNPLITWKFCHLLHKLIQDGHRRVLEQSVRYCSRIVQLGKFWHHLQQSHYGPANAAYCKMLVSRLEFHARNNLLPGNLRLNEAQMKALVNADVNQMFELAIEILDQMDELLAFESTVVKKMDNVNWSSLTPQGQCMLAPLILVILDTSKFYDHLVKLIFKLHSKLPPDAMMGHRTRFNTIFQQTKEFYEIVSNIQYFKFLVSVQKLPENAPNFLKASELDSYQAPNAYLCGDNASEVDSPSDGRSLVDEGLIDVTDAVQGPSHADEKDALIEAMRRGIEESRYDNERMVNEARARIEHYENVLSQMKQENDRYKQSFDELKSEVDQLRAVNVASEQQSATESRLQEFEQKVQIAEQNYQKMKSAYTSLRQEHIDALNKLSDAQKDSAAAESVKQNAETTIALLQEKISEMELENNITNEKMQNTSSSVDNLESKLSAQNLEIENHLKTVRELKESAAKGRCELSEEISSLKQALGKKDQETKILSQDIDKANQKIADLDCELKTKSDDINLLKNSVESQKLENARQMEEFEAKNAAKVENLQNNLFTSFCVAFEQIIHQSRDDLQNALSIVYPAQLVLPILRSLIEMVAKMVEDEKSFELSEIIHTLTFIGHYLTDALTMSAAAANVVSVEHFQSAHQQCCVVASNALTVYSKMKADSISDSVDDLKKLQTSLEDLEHLCVSLPAASSDVTAEVVGAELEREMKRMHEGIKKAVEFIEEMQKNTRAKDSGLRLEVNEKILGNCEDLMTAIIVLVAKSRAMQEEIVALGRGSAPPTDFYKRNHQWTEGLLSAAKAVGVAANVFVESADGVVTRNDKLEKLIVASQAISASTAQLFVSSRVKADRESLRLKELSQASRSVTQCTANVIATVKNAQHSLNEQQDLDFSHYTLHETKKEEMEYQVRVLELEAKLMRERDNLAKLRKQHYHLAALVVNGNVAQTEGNSDDS